MTRVAGATREPRGLRPAASSWVAVGHLAVYLLWVEVPWRHGASVGARWGDPPGGGPTSHVLDVRGVFASPPKRVTHEASVDLGSPVLGGLAALGGEVEGADGGVRAGPALVVAAIVKDEGPYLAEWVHFHVCMAGADHVLVVDHGSTPRRSAREGLKAIKRVTVYEVDGALRNPQVGVYNALLGVASEAGAEWIALLDVDEFLWAPGGGTAKDALRSNLFRHAPAVAVHWHVFGTSGHASLGSEPRVVETLLWRAGGADAGFKSVVRPRAVAAMHVHAPSRMARPGWLAVDERGLPVEGTDPDGAKGPRRRLGPPAGDVLRVNHYRLKSREDVQRRWARGGVNLDGHALLSPRGDADREAFVVRWDANEVHDSAASAAFTALCLHQGANSSNKSKVVDRRAGVV